MHNHISNLTIFVEFFERFLSDEAQIQQIFHQMNWEMTQ
jgi:hypothetical protein